MARISTHVLDIARGKPAAGLAIELFYGSKLIRSAATNSDGRTGDPLLVGTEITAGTYDLIFHAGDYLRSVGSAEPLFFDLITVRFHVDDGKANYHVPLLLAPHGYTTYRGS